jgi:transposase
VIKLPEALYHDKIESENKYLRHKVTSLEQKLVHKDKLIKRQLKLIERQATEIAMLKSQLKDLQLSLEELKLQIGAFKGKIFKPSKPDTSNTNDAVDSAGLAKTTGTHINHKVGHKGHARKTPENVDVTKRSYLTNCPHCNTALKRAGSVKTQIVEDIPDFCKTSVIVTKYEKERQYCPVCKKEVIGNPAGLIPGSRFGPNLISLLLYQKYFLKLPFEKTVEMLKLIYGLSMARSTPVCVLRKTRKFLGPKYAQLLEHVRASPVKHADETGWRINGQNVYLWGFFSNESSYLIVEESRGKGVPSTVLAGCNKASVLVSDDYAVYENLGFPRQSCWSHMLRCARDLARLSNPSDELLDLHRRLGNMFKRLSFELAKSDLSSRPKVYDRELKSIDILISKTYKSADALKVQTRLRNQREKLLTALKYENVPLTNNLAERNLRSAVLIRKISGGSRSEEGATDMAVNLSVVQSVLNQHLPFFDTIKNYLVEGSIGKR